MATRSILLLLLGFVVLASGLPYYGVKGPIRRYDQSNTKYDTSPEDEVIEKPVEKPYQIEEVIAEDEPTISYDDVKDSDKDGDFVPDQWDLYVDNDEKYIPEKEDAYDGKEPEYVPDAKDAYDVNEPDYVPDIKDGDKDGDYVPDIKDGDKDGDYVPEIKDGDKDGDYVPDIKDGDKDGDYVPDIKEGAYGDKDGDHVPDIKEGAYGDKDGDYVPDIKKGAYGDKDGDHVPDIKEDAYGDKDGDYVPDVKEGSYDIKDNSYTPDIKEGSYDVEDSYEPEEKKLTWIQRLHQKWNKFEGKSKEAARSFGHSIHTAFKGVQSHFDTLWDKFKNGFSNASLMITRGAHYVVKVVTTTVEDVKASELINKLEKRLEQGNEIVDEFFQKVGEKMTDWMEKHNHKHVDDAFFDYGKQEDQKYPDIFQDPDIHQQVNKMVDEGIISQEEADMLSQSKKEFGLFEKDGHEEKHDPYGHEGKIEEVEGPAYDKVDQTVVDDKVDHKEVNYDQGKTDIEHIEDQKDHHTIKKELEAKDTGIEERKVQTEERPYHKHKEWHDIKFPKY